MKIGSYNVENLFQRARAMNGDTLAEGKAALEAHAALNALLAKPKYTAADKKRIVALLTALGLEKADDGGSFAILRQNRGHLVKRPKNAPMEVVADGRDDWIGWIDLKLEAVNETATRATAQVIRDVGADVLAVVEAENRGALLRLSDDLLSAVGGNPYAHVMLIDGNDERGIDVGLMATEEYDITRMLSHVDDLTDDGKRLFSRDCPEYEVTTPKGNKVLILVNHLKSKANGGAAATDRRKLQAERVKTIYEGVRAAYDFVAVVGDFNDTPDSEAMAPLILGTDLKDISAHAHFVPDGRPGTYGNGTQSNKIDYILLSPKLFAAVKSGGVERRGVWGGKNGDLFPHYPEITKASESASDHAALWADVDV